MMTCSSVSPGTYSITMKKTFSCLLGREHRDDVRMTHRGEEARLLQHLAEVEVLLVRNLEGDLLVDPGVFGEIDVPKAATAEGRQNAVLPDYLTAEEH